MDDKEKQQKLAELKEFREQLNTLHQQVYNLGAEMAKKGILISPHVDATVGLMITVTLIDKVIESVESGEFNEFMENKDSKDSVAPSSDDLSQLEALVESAKPEGGWLN